MSDDKDLQNAEEIAAARNKLRAELAKVIVGQADVVDQLLVALFSRGHCLFVGVPGLAKTLLVSTLAKVLDLNFNRIQFTPDLMPADITGTDILEQNHATGQRFFKFIKGPVFANILLADEINRTPPKTQAALLQAMQEYQVSAGGTTYPLDLPFLVFATQNPIEQEGTYPLPEAQLDRFMCQINVDYPNEDEEVQVVKTTTSAYEASLEKILSPERIVALQELVRRIAVSDHVVRYAVRLVRASRPHTASAPEFVNKWVNWGAGPRGCQYLILGGKALAVLNGRLSPSCADVRALAKPILQHRVITNFHAEAEGIDSLQVVDRLLEEVPEDA